MASGVKDSKSGKLTNSQGKSVNISKEVDVWTERHNRSREQAIDQVLSATRDMNDEYGIMEHVNDVTVANMNDNGTIAFYSPSENKVVINRAFTDIKKIEESYKISVDSGFHPSAGKKSALEAVTAHELGHALADRINDARRAGGYSKLDVNSEVVISAWRKMYPAKAHTYHEYTEIPKARRNISRYASTNYHETVAEAVADVYCNGGRAKKFSKAIVAELKAVMKKELNR